MEAMEFESSHAPGSTAGYGYLHPCYAQSWAGMLSTYLLIWGIPWRTWRQQTLISGSQLDLGGKTKHLAAHTWAVQQMHIPGMLRALARLKSRKMFVGNSRAAPFTFCQIWPEMMSFLIIRRAYFCRSTDFILPEALWSEWSHGMLCPCKAMHNIYVTVWGILWKFAK